MGLAAGVSLLVVGRQGYTWVIWGGAAVALPGGGLEKLEDCGATRATGPWVCRMLNSWGKIAGLLEVELEGAPEVAVRFECTLVVAMALEHLRVSWEVLCMPDRQESSSPW